MTLPGDAHLPWHGDGDAVLRAVAPGIPVVATSAQRGDGVDALTAQLARGLDAAARQQASAWITREVASDITVGCDVVMTDSLAYCDVVLPASSHFEYDDLYPAYGQQYLQRAEAVIPPRREPKAPTATTERNINGAI